MTQNRRRALLLTTLIYEQRSHFKKKVRAFIIIYATCGEGEGRTQNKHAVSQSENRIGLLISLLVQRRNLVNRIVTCQYTKLNNNNKERKKITTQHSFHLIISHYISVSHPSQSESTFYNHNSYTSSSSSPIASS